MGPSPSSLSKNIISQPLSSNHMKDLYDIITIQRKYCCSYNQRIDGRIPIKNQQNPPCPKSILISIYSQKKSGEKKKLNFCSGTLIGHNQILTCAHSFYQKKHQQSQYSIQIEIFTENGPLKIQQKDFQIKVPQQYKKDSKIFSEYDYALLILSSNINISKHFDKIQLLQNWKNIEEYVYNCHIIGHQNRKDHIDQTGQIDQTSACKNIQMTFNTYLIGSNFTQVQDKMVISTKFDNQQGSSGSIYQVIRQNKYFGVALHLGYFNQKSFALIITKNMIQTINIWRSSYFRNQGKYYRQAYISQNLQVSDITNRKSQKIVDVQIGGFNTIMNQKTSPVITMRQLNQMNQKNNILRLILDSNKINLIEPLKKFPKLLHLIILNNPIKKIQNLDNLTELRLLMINHCQIQHIENLEKLEQLKKLDLSYNKIKSLYPLQQLKKKNYLTNLVNIKIINNKLDMSDIHNLQTIKYFEDSQLKFLI